jgi:hypothetical protein
MENPATASWGLSISDADFAKLKRGFMPWDMDDRWVIKTMTDEELAGGVTTDEELMDEATTDEATLNLDQGVIYLSVEAGQIRSSTELLSG